MGWAVGLDVERRRHIGYGVPATCDFLGCGEAIDRGLSYACGGGVVGSVENCGLFFCHRHLSFFVENAGQGGENVCERCFREEPPFDPTPDVPEWANHILTDESWAQWRLEEPEWVEDMRKLVS